MIDAFTSAALAATLACTATNRSGASAVVAVTTTASDADVLARAQKLLAELQTGTIDRSELSAELGREYTKNVIATSQQTIPSGPPTGIARTNKTEVDGVTTYVFRVFWPQGTLDYTFGYDDRTYEVIKLYFRTGPPV